VFLSHLNLAEYLVFGVSLWACKDYSEWTWSELRSDHATVPRSCHLNRSRWLSQVNQPSQVTSIAINKKTFYYRIWDSSKIEMSETNSPSSQMGRNGASPPTTAAVILDPQHWSEMQQVCLWGHYFETVDWKIAKGERIHRWRGWYDLDFWRRLNDRIHHFQYPSVPNHSRSHLPQRAGQCSILVW
jgi:hypothetical protein